MQFSARLREPILRGEITCSVRIWQRPHIKLEDATRSAADSSKSLQSGKLRFPISGRRWRADQELPELSICSKWPSTVLASAFISSNSIIPAPRNDRREPALDARGGNGLYDRIGDVFGWMSAVGGLGLVGFSFVQCAMCGVRA